MYSVSEMSPNKMMCPIVDAAAHHYDLVQKKSENLFFLFVNRVAIPVNIINEQSIVIICC